MPKPKRPLKVFLSYASQDKSLVRELSRRLVGEGWIDTWQDEKNLLPGQDWRVKIEEAVEEADVVIIVLSQHSVSKEGHVQKELRYAREIALEKPDDAIFLIPLRLDECEVPRGLRFYQWMDYFGNNKDSSYKALVASLNLRYEQKIKSEEAERLRKKLQEREGEASEKIAREKVEREAAEKVVREKVKLEIPKKTEQPIESKKKTNPLVWGMGLVALSVVGIIIVSLAIYGYSIFNALGDGIATLPSQSSNNETPVVNSPQIDGLLAVIKQRGYILVSTDPNYEPQSFLNMSGKRSSSTKCPSDSLTTAEMQGFDVDVAHKIGEFLGVETCFVTPSWAVVQAGGWADKWDVSVGSMVITVDRQKVLDFSVPYYSTLAVVAVSKDSGFNSLSDLAGKALCAGASTTYEAWINNDMVSLGLPETSVFAKPPQGLQSVILDTDQECAQALAAGRTEFVGYVTSAVIVDANISAGFPLVKLGSPVFSEGFAVAIDKSSTLSTVSLLNEIDNIINTMHQDGTLSTLSIQWFGVDLTQN